MTSSLTRLFALIAFSISTSFLIATEPVIKPFPTQGILPKAEIGALRFLEQNPEFDGRGVTVAIFDTGVDPGAAGLQTTTDGKPKVIDMVDATGSGDVFTKTIRQSKNNLLEGLSGRKLRTDPKWKNPTGKFHLGLKAAYDLFPGSLIGRLKQERRKTFLKTQHKTENTLRDSISEWDAKHPKATAEQKREKADLEEQLKQLIAAGKNPNDPGPLFDCVVFHDGQTWRAVIDTDEDSDLTDEKPLTNFRAEREYGTFHDKAMLNFAVNIYEDGNLLSIVTDSGAHSTHVAGIVSGYFPDRPEMNGIAPGAQIVSVKIGDSRLGSMETGAGLIRGLKTVVDNHCDLINMSYGEPSSTPDRGRIVELFSDAVNKNNVIFVASAGNAGPALSTVGAPGGTTTAVIGVGAYVSPEMMTAEYAMRQKLPGMPYTWTSRGPTTDGDLGVDIFAPGGAIAPVPNWTLQRNMRMNGTSMASPNACGAIALILSGLKAEKIDYSPYSVRRALQNSATPIEAADVFAQGPGLVQVDRAFQLLKEHAHATGETLRFGVTVTDRNNARGIYLRDAHETGTPLESSVFVRPIFHEHADNSAKIDFEMRMTLRSSADWLESGEHLLLTHGGQSFSVKVNPTDLEPGVHFADVQGFDADNPGRGPLFRLPITVIRPLELTNEEGQRPAFSEQLEFEPGQLVRRFISVPHGATWADIRIRSHNHNGEARRFIMHTVQTLPGETFEKSESRQFLSLAPGADTVRSIPVTSNHTLEFCLAQYWSSLGASELEYEIDFHGVEPDHKQVSISAGETSTQVEVSALLGKEQLAPSAILNRRRTSIPPTKAVIQALNPDRDRLPNGEQIYELHLTYEFTQPKAGTVTPRFPHNDDLLYDSPYGTHLWMLYDEGKRRVVTDDVYTSPVRLKKGKHTLIYQLRHTNVSILEKAKQTPLILERPLAKPIALTVYGSKADAAHGKAKLTSLPLNKGEKTALVIAAPSAGQIPRDASAGDQLSGTIRYGKNDPSHHGVGQRPGGFPIHCIVSGKKTVSQAAAKTTKSDNPLRDFKLEQLKKLPVMEDESKFQKQAGIFLKEFPKHLPLLIETLHRLDHEKHRKKHLAAVVTAADQILAQIDTKALATHYGTNVNPENPQAVKLRKTMDAQKSTLLDTLYRKGRALGYMELPDVIAEHPITDQKTHDAAFENNFTELRKWVDTTDLKYFLLHVRRERRSGRYGNALKLLNQYIPTSAPNYWHIKKRRDLYEQLGWKHLWDYEKKWLPLRFPDDYQPF